MFFAIKQFGEVACKLHIHVVDVVMEIAFERIARVNISEGRTQPIGAEAVSQNLDAVSIGSSYRKNTRN